MAADASIYSLIQQPRVQSPIEGLGGALQLKALVDQQGLQKLQRDALVRSADEDRQIRDLFSGGRTPTEAEVMAVSPKTGLAFAKTNLENQRTRAAMEKDRIAALKDTIDIHRNALGPVNDQMAYSAWRTNMVKEMPQFAATIPEQFSPDVKRDLLLKGDDLVKQLTPRFEKVGDQMVDVNPITNPSIRGMTVGMTAAERAADARSQATLAETKRHNAATEANSGKHFDSDRGVVVDLKTGATTPVAGAAKTPKLTESQGNATGFGIRAAKANDEIIALENSGTFGKKAAVKQSLGNVPLIGGALETTMNVAPSFVGGMGPEDQRYEQAQRDFINAVLRKESGANINKDEFVNARKQYFPQPGDTPEVIEQKRQNRLTAIEALKVQAGQGAPNIPAPQVAPKSLTKKTQQAAGSIKPGGIRFLGFE